VEPCIHLFAVSRSCVSTLQDIPVSIEARKANEDQTTAWLSWFDISNVCCSPGSLLQDVGALPADSKHRVDLLNTKRSCSCSTRSSSATMLVSAAIRKLLDGKH
jgi:hypothetical protein